MKRWLVLVAACGVLLSPGWTTDGAYAQSRVESDARKLEQRLHAPCCREQLLDGHESEPARALRLEIRSRLERGETSAAIEDDLKRRYGAEIVSIPADRDPRSGLSLTFTLLLSLAAALIAWLGLRWVRRERQVVSATPVEAAHAPDELDARIDAELRKLDA